MEVYQIMAYILDAIPYPIVFVDGDHRIRENPLKRSLKGARHWITFL
jgi:hypothetical protein